MTKVVRALIVIVALTLPGASGVDAQRQTTPPPTADDVMNAARKGNGPEAWALWAKVPAGPDKQRLGIQVAALTRQVDRGLDLYDELTNGGVNPDRPALTALSLAAAVELAESPEMDTRALACGAALVLDAAHPACRRALEAMTSSTRSPEEQAFGISALANARIAPYPERLGKLTLRNPLRIRFAQTLTRLPGAERLALIRPLLGDPDVATQYQAVLILSDIPGPEVATALKNVQPAGPSRQALPIALARHGDATALAAVGPMLPNLDGYLKIQAGQALAEARDSRGVQTLEAMIASPVDLERVLAAGALAPFNAAAARRALLDALAGSSAAIRPAAIYAAGRAGLGTERVIYRQLAGGSAADRAAAISALTDTLKPPARPRPPGLP